MISFTLKGKEVSTEGPPDTPLRMGSVPEPDIAFVDSTEFPVGMGEPPLIVAGPASANAIHQATGVRLRDMPIRTLKV